MSTYEHLSSLSDDLSGLVETAKKAIVMVGHEEGVPRTGFFYGTDTVVSVARQAEVGESVSVVLPDGSSSRGVVKAFDATSNIGLLTVESTIALEPAATAAVLGALAVTVAYPSVDGHEARLGMVRCIGGQTYLPGGRRIASYVQTDSPSYRGFLGAPVFDVAGTLIGISMGARDDLFILPVDELNAIIQELEKNPEIGLGYLGVRTEEAPLPSGDKSAMLVVAIEDDSPAEEAGIRVGDMVVSVGGTRTDNLQSLADALVGRNDATVGVSLQRGGETVEVSVRLGSHRWPPRPHRHHDHGPRARGRHPHGHRRPSRPGRPGDGARG